MYFKNLLKYRSVWLGIAMIWIVLFHTEMNFHNFLLDNVRSIGYGGVDICFFASGIGCFYSLASNPDIGAFIKRRFQRIAPAYLIFIVLWLLYKFWLGEFDWRMAIGNILAIQNFTGLLNDFNWYITALLFLYLLTPYFKLVIDKTNIWGKLAFLVLLIIISFPFWGVTNYIITVTRLPIYYIGMLFGYLCQKDTKIRLTHSCAFAVSFILGIMWLMISCKYYYSFLWSHGLYWYPFILITPPLCIFISCIMHILEKNKLSQKIISFFSCIGDYSFEIYLLHIPLVEIIRIIIARSGLDEDNCMIWITAMIPLSIACYVLKKLSKLTMKYLNKKML